MNEALPIALRTLAAAYTAYDKQRDATLLLYAAEFKQFPSLRGFPIRGVPSASGDCVTLRVFNAPLAGTVPRGEIRREVHDFEFEVTALCANDSLCILVDFKDEVTTRMYYPNVLEQEKEPQP